MSWSISTGIKMKLNIQTSAENENLFHFCRAHLTPYLYFHDSRMCDFNDQFILQRPVTDGKKCVIGSGEVIKRETIKLKNGKYDTYLLEPELKDLIGVFRKSENATIKIWLTADKRKIPVRIKSKIVVGSFVGELVAPEDVAK